MNFTYNIREEHKYGTFIDGKWNGLVGNDISEIIPKMI